MWRFKWVWIGLLPFPIFYFGFWKNYFLLGHHNDWQILVQYASLHLILALTILGSMLFFKLGIDKGLAVVSSMLVNSWYLYKIAPLWSVHYFNLLTKSGVGLFSLYKQWSLIMEMNGFWGCFVIDAVQLMLIISAFWCLVRNRALIKFDASFSSAKPKSTNFGTAKFAEYSEVKKLINTEGIIIGAIPNYTKINNPFKVIESIKKKANGKLIKLKTYHTTIIAPTRAGKGAGIIIPTLLDYNGAVFVTDIKGENYCVAKRARQDMGRQVYAFDPYGITGDKSLKINPLDLLNPNNPNVIDDSHALAELLCPHNSHDSGATKHFQEQSSSLLQCLMLYVSFLDDINASEKHLATVYNLLCQHPKKFKSTIETIAKDEQLAYGVPSNLANRILGTHPEELSSILTTAHNCLKFIDTPSIRKNISVSDIPLADLKSGNIDLFVCIPPQYLATQQKLLRVLTGLIFLLKQQSANASTNKLLMILDELPSLGHMKQIEQTLAYGAGYGVNLMAVSQTIGFLKNVYPNTWDSFFSNQLAVFFGCNDLATAEYVSKQIGKTTVVTQSVNESQGTQNRTLGISSSSVSVQTGNSLAETSRDILMPDEVKRLGNNVVIAFYSGEAPILCARINYWERPEWKGKFDKNPLEKH